MLEIVLVIFVVAIFSALGIVYFNLNHGEYQYTSMIKKLHERLREKQTEAMRLHSATARFFAEKPLVSFDIEKNETLVINSDNLICPDTSSENTTCFQIDNEQVRWRFVYKNDRIDLTNFTVDNSKVLMNGECVVTKDFFWNERGFPIVEIENTQQNRCIVLLLQGVNGYLVFTINKYGFITSQFSPNRPY